MKCKELTIILVVTGSFSDLDESTNFESLSQRFFVYSVLIMSPLIFFYFFIRSARLKNYLTYTVSG